MKYLYSFALFLAGSILKVVAVFNKKIALFINGRKETFPLLEATIKKSNHVIWIHCASLGEFEQGRPIIEHLRISHPSSKIVLSFFSPSGYEVRKNYDKVDLVIYLPLDTVPNAKKFLQLLHPNMAIFVKYEIWPNLLNQLRKQSITTILVSGIFRQNQLFFKSYGRWMKRSLESFSHFFVQNNSSERLLNSIGFNNTTVSGDTRFESVQSILQQDNQLNFLKNFVKGNLILVAGSTWPIDERYLSTFLNKTQNENFRCIIAPHNIDPKEIQKLRNRIQAKSSLFSEGTIATDAKVFIADTVGILTKIYSYADIAYVGGGFDKEGVHNVLEPAVFDVPLVIGPVYDKFEEAKELVNLKGCLVAQDENELHEQLSLLINNPTIRIEKGEIAGSFVKKNLGATKIIMDYIEKELADNS